MPLMKFVLSGLPFQLMVAPLTNPVPLAASVNAALPATAVLGEMLISVGTGCVMLNGKELEAEAPSGFVMVTDAVPGVAIRFADTVVERLLALMNVVLRVVLFQVIWLPDVKPVPEAVRVNGPPPAAAEFGFREVRVTGAGFTANACAFEVCAPL